MSDITLILTRTPVHEFKYGHRSGRWGAMLVVKGAKILNASVAGPSGDTQEGSGLTIDGKPLNLTTNGGQLEVVEEFDSMERFRVDKGKGFYMQVRPRLNQAYLLTMFKSSTVAELNGSGNCLRVHGHGYKQQGSGADAGILVHEAPHVGWLIGCISPRLKGNRRTSDDKGTSRKAMEKIFQVMGGFAVGKTADLFVLDW